MKENNKRRTIIRKALSSINHVKPWRQAFQKRVSTTAEWFQREPAFQQWKALKGNAVLWLWGTMGTGKTVLVSNIIAHIHTHRQPHDTISYFFCHNGLSLSARSILGSLVCQILDSQIQNAEGEELLGLDQLDEDSSASEVTKFLLVHLKPNMTCFLVIDGLDECDAGVVREVARNIDQLRQYTSGTFKVLYAGRPELDQLLFKQIAPDFKIPVSGNKIQSDIEIYISQTLGQCLDEEKLELGDPSLVIEISKCLRTGSSGM